MKSTGLLLCSIVCAVIISGLTAATFANEEGGGELVQLVITLLGDKDKDVRALGLEQVRTEAKGPAATKLFAAQLPKLPDDAKVGLLTALADRADSAARPAVLEVLATSGDELVKVAAIRALGSLGELADRRLLVQSLGAASKDERAAARASLVRLRGEAVPGAIAAEMKEATTPVRVTLIEILAERRALDTIPDLLAAAVDGDPAVRAAAMKALGQLAGPEHIAGMVQGVLRAEKGREREAAEKNVMFVCGRIAAADKRADPLLAAMEKLEGNERSALLSTLGRVGGPAALKIIEAAVGDADSAQHEIGMRALCNWPDASIAPRLIELADSDAHPDHRTRALRALIRIAPLPDERSDADRLALLKKAMAMATRDQEKNLVLDRLRAVRTLDTLHFIMPYMDQTPYAEQACLSIVELAHHRSLREPNKVEFDQALDKVIQTSKDATVIDRANRYKKGQTWVRPTSR